MVQRSCPARIYSALILLAMLSTIAPAALQAQDISGDWQGTLHAGMDLRIILHIEKNAAEKNAADKAEKNAPAKAEKDVWKATLYSIDQGPDVFR